MNLSIAQYMLRVKEYSRAFPNLKMSIVAVTADYRIWTKQRFIYGRTAEDLPELIYLLKAHKWDQVSHNRFQHRDTKVVISDATAPNIIFDGANTPHFIDVIVEDLGVL